MGYALCMVCNVWNITQVEAKCYRMSTMMVLECMVLFHLADAWLVQWALLCYVICIRILILHRF